MAQVIWSPLAFADLEAIREHIAQDNPPAATRVLLGLLSAAKRLEDFPLSGREIPHDRARGARELIRRPYRVAYDVRGETVRILRVHHSAQDVDWSTLGDEAG